jgi:hypothetical protein
MPSASAASAPSAKPKVAVVPPAAAVPIPVVTPKPVTIPSSAPASTKNCSPPFWYDAAGTKHFKPECM